MMRAQCVLSHAAGIMASTLPSEKPGNALPPSECRGGAHTGAPARSNGTRSIEEFETALIAIRQARDTVIARNLELSSKLALAEDRDPETDLDQLARLLNVRVEDVRRVTRKYLDLERCAGVVVR